MSIVLEHLYKRFGTQSVVNDLSLEIGSGELFVLLGSSGSGKSTVLRLIAGLIAQDEGRIFLNGSDMSAVPTQQRGVGFVFQNYSLFRHMTAAQNIEFGLQIRNLPRAERHKRVNELLEMIGLPGYGGRLPAQLSGGQQQRIALARALAPRPNVLLLDEPFGALDVKIRTQLRTRLREIQRELKVTTILVTHDQEEAFELGDRIGIIEAGRLLEVGTPSELYRRPQHLFTATFLGVANLLQGQRNGTHVHVGDLALPAPPNSQHLSNKPVTVVARPEAIELSLTRDALNGEPVGRGVITSVDFAGAVQRITVDMVKPQQMTLSALITDGAASSDLNPGQAVWIGLKSYHLVAAEQGE
ncbi:MAG: ABC transporter ATP-binding protein [Anaerolineae bacterium]